MKRLFIIIFFIAGFIYAQDAGDLPTKSSLESTDVLFVNDLDADTTYSSALSNLALFMFQYDRVMSANLSLTGTVQLPSTLNATLARGVGYNAGAFSFVEDGAIKNAADQAWVLQMIADSGVAVDTNAFGLLAGNQTWTGTNVFNLMKIGSGSNVGNFKIPYYTTGAPSAIAGALYYDATNNKLKVYEGPAWISFPDSSTIYSMITTGSWLPQTGTMIGLTSTLTWNSGTITPYKLSFGGNDAGKSLILPKDKNRAVSAETGSILYDYNNTKNLMVHDGSSWLSFLNEDNIQTKIETHLSYDAPSTVSDADADTLYFSDNNYIANYYTSIAESGTDIYVSNSTNGVVKIAIESTSNTVNFYAKNGIGQTAWGTIRWVGGVAPILTGSSRTYLIMFERLTSTILIGSYTWAE